MQPPRALNCVLMGWLSDEQALRILQDIQNDTALISYSGTWGYVSALIIGAGLVMRLYSPIGTLRVSIIFSFSEVLQEYVANPVYCYYGVYLQRCNKAPVCLVTGAIYCIEYTLSISYLHVQLLE